MNHLNSIYQRLQSNYSDCDITYAPGLLTVKCKNGEIRADGFRTCFLEDGKTVQELLEKNDDNLYEEMERSQAVQNFCFWRFVSVRINCFSFYCHC